MVGKHQVRWRNAVHADKIAILVDAEREWLCGVVRRPGKRSGRNVDISFHTCKHDGRQV